MKTYLLTLFAFIALISCSFPRDNPLDPEHSGISAPPKITNVNATSSSDRVTLTWDRTFNVDGFYVYRADYYHGNYRRLEPAVTAVADSIMDWQPSFLDDDQSLIHGKEYWYRVSGFKQIPDAVDFLEGELSEKEGIRIN
jgi:hypothetical protein